MPQEDKTENDGSSLEPSEPLSEPNATKFILPALSAFGIEELQPLGNNPCTIQTHLH